MSSATDPAERIRFLEDRLGILSRALRSFAEATTDYARLLDVVARTLSEVVKDGCVVRLLSKDGWLTPVAIHLPVQSAVADPATVQRVREHITQPKHVSEQEGARRVLETGEPALIAKLDLDQLKSTSSSEVAAAYETLGIHSLMLVALRVRGESIGLLAMVRFAPSSPAFNQQDFELAQAIADHAALAITNARLLQGALLDLAHRERAEKELRRTEAQLRQSQKMDAVGRLAGGIAHDFNNILSVILTYSDMALSDEVLSPALLGDIKEIRRAGLRAAELTKQLLAFSRQQVLAPEVLELNQTVENIEKMLSRVLGEDIELTTLLAAGLWPTKVDGGQVEQVLMNLAVNARDAMPRGGKLTIETRNVTLDEEYASSHEEVTAGDYVMVAVTDDGSGMDRETQARLFEPFFTTKNPGKGTGLGLATVFGIVKQSGGHIWVYSEVGEGTTFKVYFPRTGGTVQPPAKEGPTQASPRGTETILLVEDDEQVRVLARNILRRHGYVVLEAANGGEAMLLSEQHGAKIHLLLTDVVMPRMSGRVLAERLAGQRPEMKVLFTSGFTDDAMLQHGVLDSGVSYLQKPITPGALTRKVRDVLG